nr:ISNCY family transposase [uncultured Rhodopila sp.]
MGRISMATRDELVVALTARYAASNRAGRGRILDEFVAISGLHRKHAMRLLRAGGPGRRSGPRAERRVYDAAVREALIVLWEASDRICGKRLRPLEAMERHGHLQLVPEVRAHLLAMSAATIDRALRTVRERAGGRKRRHAAPSAAIRRSVPVRTFDGWNDPPPGFVEADLVAHSGTTAKGSYVQTLTLTDIATGWTECAPLLVREQKLLIEVLSEMRARIPFALLGFDTDNDSVFMNETVKTYCDETGLVFTRCRPYRKNDQAWVEQKNGAVVRHAVGYRRYEGVEAATALARLYAVLRLFVNFFQPSFKLAGKARDGAKVKKSYHPPATPYQRLLANPRTSEEVRRRVSALYATLDPVELLREVRAAQQALVDIADRPFTGEAGAPAASTLEQFLSGLRIAWQAGEVRPTSQPKAKARRGRRRPDPFVSVTSQMRAWFEAEPWRTAGELFERLQDEHPGVFPDGQLRTLQRRLKEWRQEQAHRMVFGAEAAGQPVAGSALPSP